MRLIDADNLEFCGIGVFDHDGEPMMRMEDVRESVNNAPTIDAVPVVRCRECKHFNMQEMECENDAISTDHEGGASYSLNFYLDDFCSYGEKEGAD